MTTAESESVERNGKNAQFYFAQLLYTTGSPPTWQLVWDVREVWRIGYLVDASIWHEAEGRGGLVDLVTTPPIISHVFWKVAVRPF